MSVLLLMVLGALVSDLLVLTILALSPRIRREIALRLFSSISNEDQEEGDEESLDISL